MIAEAEYVRIDNLEVSDYVTVWDCNCSEYGKQTVMAVDDLQYLPSADVAEVKHGKFIKRTPYSEAECDQCGKCPKLLFGILPNYCPHCGAKMDGKQQKEG